LFWCHPIKSLSETEEQAIQQQVWDQTGLTIGAKSIKNYSIYVADPARTGLKIIHRQSGYLASSMYQRQHHEISERKKKSHYPTGMTTDKFLKESKKAEPAATLPTPQTC
jgi:L-rhamnose mutarotase